MGLNELNTQQIVRNCPSKPKPTSLWGFVLMERAFRWKLGICMKNGDSTHKNNKMQLGVNWRYKGGVNQHKWWLYHQKLMELTRKHGTCSNDVA